MLLVIDAGNSNTAVGLYDRRTLAGHWEMQTDWRRTADEYGFLLAAMISRCGPGQVSIDGCAISSVVPALTATLAVACRRFIGVEPLVVGPDTRLSLEVPFADRHEVGSDRLMAAGAAYAKYGGPLIVVDLGTATTYNAVSGDGAFLGGAIAPGIGISAEALFARAARLDRVPLLAPGAAIGHTTESSLQSGIVFGFAGQVEAMVGRLSAELPGGPPHLVLTGGWSALMATAIGLAHFVEPHLVLEGLRLVYGLNRTATDR